MLVQACGCAALLADALARLVQDANNGSAGTTPSTSETPTSAGASLLQSWLPLGTALAATATAAVEDATLPKAAESRIAAEADDEARLRLQLIEAICPSDAAVSEDTVRSMVHIAPWEVGRMARDCWGADIGAEPIAFVEQALNLGWLTEANDNFSTEFEVCFERRKHCALQAADLVFARPPTPCLCSVSRSASFWSAASTRRWTSCVRCGRCARASPDVGR